MVVDGSLMAGDRARTAISVCWLAAPPVVAFRKDHEPSRAAN